MSERSASRGTSGDRIAVGHAGCVMLLDAATGQVVWERALNEIPGASACDGQPVNVRLLAATVIAAAMGHVFALAVEDGSVLWHLDRRGRGAGTTSIVTQRE